MSQNISAIYHFLLGAVIGEVPGNDVSIREQNIAYRLQRRETEKACVTMAVVRSIRYAKQSIYIILLEIMIKTFANLFM